MKSLRDFESNVDMLSDREIDDLQAAIDARREARAGRVGRRSERDGAAGRAPRKGSRAS